jgi:hypothetical protein
MRPIVSTNLCLPVKNGWHAEQSSTRRFFFVERVTHSFHLHFVVFGMNAFTHGKTSFLHAQSSTIPPGLQISPSWCYGVFMAKKLVLYEQPGWDKRLSLKKSAIAEMLCSPKPIKCPVIVEGARVHFGFDKKRWGA